MAKFVVIAAECGSLLGKWTAHGPFDNEDDAADWADTHRGDTGEPAYEAEVVAGFEAATARWTKKPFVLIRGHLEDGLRLYGPFKTRKAVDDLALEPVPVQAILPVQPINS